MQQGVVARTLTTDSVLQNDRPPLVREPALVPDFVNTTCSMFNLATVMFLPELEAEVALGTEIRRMTRALIVYSRRSTFPLTFEWDPDKAASNATTHGIDFRESVQRWRDP